MFSSSLCRASRVGRRISRKRLLPTSAFRIGGGDDSHSPPLPFIGSGSSHPPARTFNTRAEPPGVGREEPDYTLESVIEDLDKAASYNQGKGYHALPRNAGIEVKDNRWDAEFCWQTLERYEYWLNSLENVSDESSTVKLFLSPKTTVDAFSALLRCRLPPHVLSEKVREYERLIGSLGLTNMTEDLSLAMLQANGKAGNVGRAIQLLELRKSRDHEPQFVEFEHAIAAIKVAGTFLRKNRNTFLPDKDQPQIDDPTRWLDAILLNMNRRGFDLPPALANQMLNTFATTGKTGKGTHYFYRVLRSPCDGDEQVTENDGRPTHLGKPVDIKLSMRPPPPYHKLPSQVRGKMVRKPGSEVKQLKLDRESDPDWSPPLTSAFAFADSLEQGACGHDPIELNLTSYTILMKACVNRGSLWRAMQIMDEVIPKNGIELDAMAYNTLLNGLARVGDVPTIRDYYNRMLAQGITPTKETVEAVVNGLLNLGDVPSAITVVQDCFNQYSVLPPYTTHLKILEFALGQSLVFEAKRHVYFIQQLWKWEKNDYHSYKFARLMELTKLNPHISKEALQKLFAYFGESLDDSDFL